MSTHSNVITPIECSRLIEHTIIRFFNKLIDSLFLENHRFICHVQTTMKEYVVRIGIEENVNLYHQQTG